MSRISVRHAPPRHLPEKDDGTYACVGDEIFGSWEFGGTHRLEESSELLLSEAKRKEMAKKRKEEEERRRKQAEEQERARQRAADEERRRREELQRQEEAKARRPKEKRALIRLYEDTNGEKWNRSGGWLSDDVDQ